MHEISKIEHQRIAQALEDLVERVVARHRDTPDLVVTAVANGGLVFARKLAQSLALRLCRDVPIGVVNIAFHRDDIGLKPIPLNSAATDLPFVVDDATILLADDVFHTGRTARAALNELLDHGRPARVELAVLCDRGGRTLPILPDYTGFPVEASPDHRVEVKLDFDYPIRDCVRVLST
jgi:pyrimidine operon attenuation protein/uracil phosphoribosyltransferase